MRPFAIDGVVWSVALSVCLAVMTISYAKAAEPIELILVLFNTAGISHSIQESRLDSNRACTNILMVISSIRLCLAQWQTVMAEYLFYGSRVNRRKIFCVAEDAVPCNCHFVYSQTTGLKLVNEEW